MTLKKPGYCCCASDSAAKALKALLSEEPEILEVEWTHRHYVEDDEYILYGDDIPAFLKREIAKPIIRWEETKKNGTLVLGYEILPNKYFYRYEPPPAAEDMLAEFWRLEEEADCCFKGWGGDERADRTRSRTELLWFLPR